jgi:hypothetical protein
MSPRVVLQEQLKQRLDRILSLLGGLPVELREVGSTIRAYLSRELELVDELRETAAELATEIISDFIFALREPHGKFTLLGQGELIKPTPFFYTALREFPTTIQWKEQKGDKEYEYDFLLLNCETATLITSSRATETSIDLTQLVKWNQDVRYEWRIYVYENGKRSDSPWFNAIFWLLPEEKKRFLEGAEEKSQAISDPLLRSLTLATLYTEYELYEEAIRLLTSLIEPLRDSVESVPLRRALAETYRKAYDSLEDNQDYSRDNIKDVLNEEVKQIYCLDLGLYETYQADGCEGCNKCGLIP